MSNLDEKLNAFLNVENPEGEPPKVVDPIKKRVKRVKKATDIVEANKTVVVEGKELLFS